MCVYQVHNGLNCLRSAWNMWWIELDEMRCNILDITLVDPLFISFFIFRECVQCILLLHHLSYAMQRICFPSFCCCCCINWYFDERMLHLIEKKKKLRATRRVSKIMQRTIRSWTCISMAFLWEKYYARYHKLTVYAFAFTLV